MQKVVIAIAALILVVCTASAQNVNQQLFKAVAAKDTVDAEALLQKGADANYAVAVGTGGWKMSLLILATNNENVNMVKALIKHGAKVDVKDQWNTTPLMYAAYSGNMELIRFLLDHGADVKATDGKSNTVLSSAKEGKHQEAITLIESLLK